jgi:hypothetical protein
VRKNFPFFLEALVGLEQLGERLRSSKGYYLNRGSTNESGWKASQSTLPGTLTKCCHASELFDQVGRDPSRISAPRAYLDSR